MAELGEIVQKILLEGDVEIINKLGELGKQGFETFQELAQAAAEGKNGMEIFATGIGLAATALVGALGAVGAFVEGQAEAIQQTNLLAKAFGASTEQLSSMQAAFASAGVSTNTFETFAQRLTVTIAREWPSIAESIRTASDQQASAQERVVASTLRVQDAQRSLGFVNDETASKIANSNIRVEQTFNALQDNAQKAFKEMEHDQLAAASAGQSLEAAQQRLATLEGRPPSAADKQALQLAEAKLAVDKALQAQSDASAAARQHQSDADLKARQLAQAAADAELHHETAISEAQSARVKAELAVKEAVTARAEAEEHASQVALKSIPAIRDALVGMIANQAGARESIDLTAVSIRDLGKGLIAAASAANGGGLPTGLATLTELSKLLSSEQGKLISDSQRLALVMNLGQQRMQQTGASASELLGVLERGPAIFQKYGDTAEKAFSNSPEAAHSVERFKDAFELLAFNIQLVNRDLASAALPIFTSALDAIRESLTSSTGLLHGFVDGVKAIGTAFGALVTTGQELFAAIDHAFDLEPGRAWQIFIISLIALVGAFASSWLAIPVAIAAVITAVGYLKEHWDELKTGIIVGGSVIIGVILAFGSAWLAIPVLIGLVVAAMGFIVSHWDKIKAGAAEAWKSFTDNAVVKFIENVVERMKDLLSLVAKIATFGLFGGKKDAVATPAANDNGDTAKPPISRATGGPVRGPGTKTSDSIPAYLSDGEFVMSAAAVDTFGTSFMHSINSMQFPGFAAGGTPSPVSRPGTSGPVPATSVLNLSIDGKSFDGLRGPKDVVDSLAGYAITRQLSSAGRQPSWVR